MKEDLASGWQTVEYEFMVPVYHDVVGAVPLGGVSLHGGFYLLF